MNWNWDITAVVAAGTAVVVINQWFVRSIVKDEMNTLLSRMNGRYIYSNGADLTGAEIERRLETLEDFRRKAHR